jgi:hypothetical protein
MSNSIKRDIRNNPERGQESPEVFRKSDRIPQADREHLSGHACLVGKGRMYRLFVVTCTGCVRASARSISDCLRSDVLRSGEVPSKARQHFLRT